MSDVPTSEVLLYDVVSDIFEAGQLSATCTINTATGAQVVVTINVVKVTDSDGDVIYNIQLDDLLSADQESDGDVQS